LAAPAAAAGQQQRQQRQQRQQQQPTFVRGSRGAVRLGLAGLGAGAGFFGSVVLPQAAPSCPRSPALSPWLAPPSLLAHLLLVLFLSTCSLSCST